LTSTVSSPAPALSTLITSRLSSLEKENSGLGLKPHHGRSGITGIGQWHGGHTWTSSDLRCLGEKESSGHTKGISMIFSSPYLTQPNTSTSLTTTELSASESPCVETSSCPTLLISQGCTSPGSLTQLLRHVSNFQTPPQPERIPINADAVMT
jgi:hypothetical protein